MYPSDKQSRLSQDEINETSLIVKKSINVSRRLRVYFSFEIPVPLTLNSKGPCLRPMADKNLRNDCMASPRSSLRYLPLFSSTEI